MNHSRIAALSAVLGLSALGSIGLWTLAYAGTTVEVGGAAMYPSKTIVDNAVNSKDHTTLVAAVKAAGLVDTLKSAGPFTVFAPVNKAFEKLPAGTVDTLLKPENKAMLTSVLTYHVVPGKLSAADLMAQVKAGGGTAMLKTGRCQVNSDAGDRARYRQDERAADQLQAPSFPARDHRPCGVAVFPLSAEPAPG